MFFILTSNGFVIILYNLYNWLTFILINNYLKYFSVLNFQYSVNGFNLLRWNLFGILSKFKSLKESWGEIFESYCTTAIILEMVPTPYSQFPVQEEWVIGPVCYLHYTIFWLPFVTACAWLRNWLNLRKG